MKKFLSLLLAATMVVSSSAMVLAAEDKSSSTLVKYGVGEVYEVSIPAEIDLDENGYGEAELVVGDNFLIASCSTLEVYISGHDYTDAWELIDTAEATNKLEYTINDTIKNNDLVLSVEAGHDVVANPVVETLRFQVTSKLAKSGNYNDTLTFRITLSNDGTCSGAPIDGYKVSLALTTDGDTLANVTLVKEEEQASTFAMRTIDDGEASLMGEEEPIEDEGVTSYPMTYNSVSKQYEAIVQETGLYSVVAEAEKHIPYTLSNVEVTGHNSFTITLVGGDVTGDGEIGFSDLSCVLNTYNSYNEWYDITGDGYVDWQELFIILNNYGKTSSDKPPVKAEAGAVSFNLDVEEGLTYETQEPIYKMVVSVKDTVGDLRLVRNTLTFDNNIVIPVDYYDATIPDYSDEVEEVYPINLMEFKSGRDSTSSPTISKSDWTMDGANSKFDMVFYWSSMNTYPIENPDTAVYEIYFKLADGKTIEDITSDTFGFDFIAYANEAAYYYGHNNASLNTITVNNNIGK